MPSERFVVLGLGNARAEWCRTVARWSTGASIPVEFLNCLSVEELQAHLASDRALSASMVDAGLPSTDRDLIERSADSGCPVIVVDQWQRPHWLTLGASAVVAPSFTQEELIGLLRTHSRALPDPSVRLPLPEVAPPDDQEDSLVVALCGPGGTGVSTLAMGLAQGLASSSAGDVLLADLARWSQQAMLHDAADVVPGVVELVDAHRGGRPSGDELRKLTFRVQERGYHLMLGLPRPSAWPLLRPRAFEAGFRSLIEEFRTVVVDTDSDVEGEMEGGSADVEDRNVMARTAIRRADVILAVGRPGAGGLHSLLGIVDHLLHFGVSPERVVPICNMAPRSPVAKAELARAFADLRPSVASKCRSGLLFVPERPLEGPVRQVTDLPKAIVQPLTTSVLAIAHSIGDSGRPSAATGPRRITPGSVGHWSAPAGTSVTG